MKLSYLSIAVLSLLAFAGFVPLETASAQPMQQTPQVQQTITARIVKVIDAATIKVRYKDRDAEFGLIGIDRRGSRKYTASVAMLAKEGDAVTIEFDALKRQNASRFLGYLYLNNGKMLNEEILRAGYAKIMLTPPNFRYKEKLFAAYKEARNAKRGVWGGSVL